MTEQESEFQRHYGLAMLYAHMIEHLLLTHLQYCRHFQVNDYTGSSRSKLAKMNHEDRIDELLKVYPEADNSAVARLVPGLHLLRKIRNILTHEIIPQVGDDLSSEEGIEQLTAMLRKIAAWERSHLDYLQHFHKILIRATAEARIDRLMGFPSRPPDCRVSTSKIQSHLAKLERFHDEWQSPDED